MYTGCEIVMGNLEITMMEHTRDFSFLQVRLWTPKRHHNNKSAESRLPVLLSQNYSTCVTEKKYMVTSPDKDVDQPDARNIWGVTESQNELFITACSGWCHNELIYVPLRVHF